MSVYKRGYRRYSGPLTGRWARFLVLPRYAWRRLYQQRLVLLLTILAFMWPLLCAGFIYLTNYVELLQGLDPEFRQFIQVNGQFFSIFMYVQGSFAVFLVRAAARSEAEDTERHTEREPNESKPSHVVSPFSRRVIRDAGSLTPHVARFKR